MKVNGMKSWRPQNLKMASVVQGEGAITNIDFHKDGKYVVVSTTENSIQLIDSLSGVEKKKLYVKSLGVGKMKFTHHEQCVLISNEKVNYDISYLSLFDNRYIRFFRGHKSKVISISMNPTDDHFLSSSLDGNVFLWNLGSCNPIAQIILSGNFELPYVSYDSSGVIFGVLAFDTKVKCHSIRLFDSKNYVNGPFQEIAPTIPSIEQALLKLADVSSQQIQRVLLSSWTSIEFSSDGQKILINTSSDLIIIIDSFNPDVEPLVIMNRKNELGITLGGTFSSDAQFIIVGNEDNEIQIYDATKGELQVTLTGHVSPVGYIKCNPKYDVIASGCVNTALWIQSN